MKFLIVDDSAFMRTQIKHAFSAFLHIEFEEAVDGIDALERHRIFKPDVIILDYVIPAPDGLAVLKILTKIDKKVKVIMVTSLGNQKFLYKDCIECGAFTILTKPIAKEDALKTIKNIHARVIEYEKV